MVTSDFMKVIKPLKLSLENHPSLSELPSPSVHIPGGRQPLGLRPPWDFLVPSTSVMAEGRQARLVEGHILCLIRTSQDRLTEGTRLGFPKAPSTSASFSPSVQLPLAEPDENRNLTETLSCFAGTFQHILMDLSKEHNYLILLRGN